MFKITYSEKDFINSMTDMMDHNRERNIYNDRKDRHKSKSQEMLLAYSLSGQTVVSEISDNVYYQYQTTFYSFIPLQNKYYCLDTKVIDDKLLQIVTSWDCQI